ncbi:MAG: hypothetical protein ACMUJM_20660 [bacterium]
MKKLKRIILPLLIFWILAMEGTYVVDQLRIDLCLDRGGSFNYKTFTCDMVKTHKAIPYLRAR